MHKMDVYDAVVKQRYRELREMLSHTEYRQTLKRGYSREQGKTPLHAAVGGHAMFVRLLLEQEERVPPYSWHHADYEGCMPIHLAARSGATDILKLLLPYGGTRHADIIGWTPAHAAAANGHLAAVETLLLADPGAATVLDTYNMTPLHWAVMDGHMDIASCLLAHNAPLNEPQDGFLPIQYAVIHGRVEIIELLVAIAHMRGLPSQLELAATTVMEPNREACMRVLMALGAKSENEEKLTESEIRKIRRRVYFRWTLLDRVLHFV